MAVIIITAFCVGSQHANIPPQMLLKLLLKSFNMTSAVALLQQQVVRNLINTLSDRQALASLIQDAFIKINHYPGVMYNVILYVTVVH